MTKNKNASFVERLGALLIDLFIITIVTSLFSMVVVDNDNYNKLSDESSKLMEEYISGKVKPTTYISRASDISYDISRETAGLSIITVGIYILYFIVFQYKRNGQTLGKKLLKLRVVSNNDEELTMNSFAIRSLLVNSIFFDIILLSVTILCTKDVYFISSLVIEFIEYSLLFAIALTVLTRKDKRGIHDLITNTKVIKEV